METSNLILLIYVIGIVVLPFIFGFLNLHYKWISELDMDASLRMAMLLYWAAWPIAIFVFIATAILKGFEKYFIPKDY